MDLGTLLLVVRGFFENITYMIYFWALILLIGFLGATVFKKFKNSFVDYL